MPRGPAAIEPFFSTAELGVTAETGAHANPEDFGAQIGQRMEQLGGKISEGGATVAEIGEMRKHMEAQQWVSKTMTDHRNMVDKYMADPKNYSDPKFAENVGSMFEKTLPELQKQAPSLIARNQLSVEYRDLHAERLESALKTTTEMTLQKGFNDYALMSNQLLNSYRTNLKSPNIDAGAELFKQTDDIFKKIDASFGKIAPTMARELKDQVTSQLAYGAVNTNPDLAEKILNRGYLEGRTRHFLEDAIDRARSAQSDEFRQSAVDAEKNLLIKAELHPEIAGHAFPPSFYEAHGFTAKEAQNRSLRMQDQFDIISQASTIKQNISGMNEDALFAKDAELTRKLDTSENPAKDYEVLDRVKKFIQESVTTMHEDPVKYLANFNKELSSTVQSYRENPTPQKFQAMNSLLMKYQGAAPTGEDASKYLNLPLHEQHLLDEQQSLDHVKDIMGGGPKNAGDKLHQLLQSYRPEEQGLVMRDLMNKGKLPIEACAAERIYGAQFAPKVMGAIMQAKELRETVGRQKGSTAEDLDKLLDTNNMWLDWSKTTAADNFQRQDVVAGFRSTIYSYALGMIQEGKTPKEAINGAVEDLTQWGHDTAQVNGHKIQVPRGTYKGTEAEFSRAIFDALGNLDVNRIKLTDDRHRPIFPVLDLAGHAGAANDALRDQIRNHVVPHNNDDNSFSLYYQGDGNLFQLRDRDNKPFVMQYSDLPTYSYYSGYQGWEGNQVTHWPTKSAPDTGEPKQLDWYKTEHAKHIGEPSITQDDGGPQ